MANKNGQDDRHHPGRAVDAAAHDERALSRIWENLFAVPVPDGMTARDALDQHFAAKRHEERMRSDLGELPPGYGDSDLAYTRDALRDVDFDIAEPGAPKLPRD
jgi:hypothetical protein